MFALSKIAGALTDPMLMTFLLLAGGTGLLWCRRTLRLGRDLLTLLVTLLLLLALVPVDRWLMTALEDRFPAPESLPERVDGIIVLGGAIDPVVSTARDQVTVNSAATRLTALPALAARYPEARLIFSGGSGLVLRPDLAEADQVGRFYREIGFPPERVELERRSRNTRENAVYTKQQAHPRPGETWLLVTSALHMPRAIGCFRAVGWSMVPYPVDYHTTGAAMLAPSFNPFVTLGGLGVVGHELIGLVVYHLRGWTDSLLPGP